MTGGDTVTKAIETGSDSPDGADGALVVRPFRAGDSGPILEVMLDVLDRGEYDGLARHHLETASARLADEPDWSAVAEVDGRIAGWVAPRDDDLTVAPAFRRRGIGTRLVAAGRAIAARDGRDVLRLWVSRRPGPEAFARAMGMRYRSSLWQMRLPADIRPEPPRFPDDVRVRAFDAGLDETPFVDLVNTIFLDHPSPFCLTEAQVRRVHAMPGFDPTTILLVTDAAAPGRMVGFCRVHMFADDAGRRMGEIRLLGVRREARGRGIGRALTAWGIAKARRRGAGDVVLAVEGENDGATRIYEGLGLRREVEWPHWTMPSTDARGTDGG